MGREDPAEIAEECCFLCKDGGDDLRVCDVKNCLKAYHPSCVVLSPDEQFICDWHRCVNCNKSSDYQCLCCPLYSVCRECLGKVEFVQVGKQTKGFCSNCLNLAILIEKNADADPCGAKIDYRDAKFYEILFKDYWEVIKDREHLTLVDLEEASVFLNRRLNCKEGANSEKFPDEDHKSEENILAYNDANGQTIPFDSKGKQNKMNTSLKNNKSNKKTFVGWGSEELIAFLSSYGKDTTKSLDEAEVVNVVKEYIRQKNLYKNNNRKSFLCDDKLQPLFTRRKVRCRMIRRFLAVHLAANVVSEDESFDGSEDDDAPIMKKKPQNSLEPKISKRVSERNKRCFASLNQNNLKLIYLRRSLVINLLGHLDTFEQKVVGCFVRVKNGPKVHSYQMSKKAYQLGLVTGIKKSSEEYKIKDKCTNIFLCVTGLWDDVKISMLSDEDFAEDECNDLIPLVKKGLLKRATVAELEEKVATVHTDIVNHWIDKELVRLEKEIERAHEKGWRREMEELFHQKKLLSTPSERQRRLEEVPEIVPDTEHEEKETELEVAVSNSSQENRGKKRDRASCFMDVEEHFKGATQQGASSLNDLEEESPKAEDVVESLEVLKEKPPEGLRDQVTDSLNISNEESSEGATQQIVDPLNVLKEKQSKGAMEQISDSLNLLNKESSEVASKQGDATRGVPSEAGEACSSDVTPDPALHSQMHNTQGDSTTQAMDIDQDESNRSQHVVATTIKEVIVLDSDEDEDLHTVQHKPEGKASHAPNAMNGGNLHTERSESASPAALLAQVAMNGVLHPEHSKPARAAEQQEPARAAMNGVSPLTPVWHYLDPQGHAQGPFALMRLLRWKQNGFFDDDFRVWRTGQTVEQAILLTDAFRM